ncbi:hypothetical protein [Azospirillum rugosum]|uniref:Uncharacterized protein n=1 Tax=Azospirillum rugosum TaxID=416170 RepID=A0ABS4SUH3_9PROT|nr:hypothetical protein [Azospirillum rugosum]MBP2296082.1 hypothetical protein [Azospirillum rugosum]MDQ0530763.1 hypothetical protein [Azospirillum rugosum]
MPDLHDTASPTPLLTIPDALTSEAAAMLLGGNVGGLKAVQAKLAAALADQGLPGSDAGRAAEGWVRSFAAGMENAASPDAAIAEANRITAGTAARMAQALQDSGAMTGEQRLAAALAQGQGIEQAAAANGRGSADLNADLNRALFDGVMAPPAGSAHPMEALSRALTQPVGHAPLPPAADPSPIEKLTAALASGVALPDAVKAVAPDGTGLFAATLERALSSGEDAASAVAAATERTAQGGAQAQAAAVEQSDGDRLVSALAVGGSAAVRGVGDGAAFTTVLSDALAHGSAPDAALGASARAQADMTARVSAAGVPPKPADTLLASLASGHNVAETVKSFAAATGIDPKAAGGFSQALGNALSSGQEAAGALGAARQDVFAATAMASAAAQGVKGNSLVAALASGQNVQQAVQAVGGAGGAFSAALGQALAEGRSPGQALAAARQSTDTVQRNSQSSEVPISPENKALADLATPGGAAEKSAAADGGKADKTTDADAGSADSGSKESPKDAGDGKDAKEAEAEGKGAEQVADNGEKATDKGADKDGAKDGAEDGKDAAGDKAAEGSAVSDSSAPDAPSPSSESGSKSAGMANSSLTPVTISPPDTGGKSGSPADGGGRSTAASATQPASTSPISKVGTTDPFATTAQTQQRVAQALARLAETTTPPVAEHQVQAPTMAPGFDAAALAKALAVAEDTAAPAGFTVFHLIEAMFRPGEAGSSVVGVAVVANAGSALGVWQYSVDGATWTEVGTVSDAAALLLPGTALLRFLPAADAFGSAPALGLRAVNEGWVGGFSDSAHRLFALGGTGGTSSLSEEIAQVSLEVTPVNDAPVATGTAATMATIAEDTTDLAGSTVTALFGALFSDTADAANAGSSANAFAGIAIVSNAATAAQGVWQYWTGSAWTAIGAVSDNSALLLSADAKLRFVPSANWNGTTPALTVRLADDSAGVFAGGDRVNVASLGVGGTSAYSAGTITLTGTVTAVNDAPVAIGATAVMPTIAEDAANPSGATVSALFGALFSDAADSVTGGSAANNLAGVAVVGNAATAAQGDWQYWTGAEWATVGTVSEGSALLLAADTKLRFVPAVDWNGTTPALTVRLVDDSRGAPASGNRVDLSTGAGGTTAYSAGTIALTGTVAAVNDAPVATGTAVLMAAIAEDTADPTGATVSSLFGSLFSDAADAVIGGSSANGFAGIAIVGNDASAAQGVWQYWTGSAWAAVGNVSEDSALVVAAADKLRFVPAASWNGTTPALTVRMVDDSQGTPSSGERVDLGTGVGGTTAYSAGTIALAGAVTAVNDAPVAIGTTATLPPIAEDTTNPAGATVTALFGALFSDSADAVAGGSSANGFAGIAIVGNAASTAQGVWQYWTGSAWSTIGAVSDNSALLLSADAKLRFVPSANWNGTTPALTVRLVDDSAGNVTSGGRVDLASLGVGGTTAYSAGTIALTGSITAVNDAPVAVGISATMAAIAEDAANPAGATISALFATLFSDAADAVTGGSAADGFAGVAIVGNAATAAQGVWQYWTGTNWIAVEAVSDGSALLLAADTKLRFVPAANWDGTTPALTARLVDASQGALSSGDRTDLGTGVGGTTPYSVGTIALTGTITAVNDAPVALGTAATMAAIAEDTASPAGATVSAVFGALFSDAADAVSGGSAANGFAGIVIVGNAATATQGVWQYWTGSVWVDVGTVSEGSALLLSADAKLRFVPAANWNGTTPALTVRLVDDSQGTLSSGRVDLGTGVGGTTAYSAGTIALTGSVIAVNDAPVAMGTTATMAAIAEDTINPAGATVTSLFSALFSDATDAVSGGSSANGFAGIAIIGNGASAAQGTWQYWTGTAWTAVGAVSDGSALLLAADAKLRFVPAANWNGTTPALTVRLVDDSAGNVVNGGRVNLTSLGVGGTSAYSAGTIALTGAVTAVNDAPVAVGTSATMAAIAEDTANPAGATVSALFGSLFSDTADTVTGGSAANGFAGVAVVANPASAVQGTWQYWNGSAWTAVETVSNGSALLLAADAKLRFVPAADWNGTTPALTVRLVDDSQGTLSSGDRVDLSAGVGGTTAYSAGTVALTGAVTAVNDAPVATGTTATMAAIAEDTANPAGATVTSLFGSVFSDAADAVSGGSSANGFAGIAIVGNAASAAQGVWQYWTGTNWAAVGTVSEGFALVVAAADKLRFVPAANWNGTTPALTVRLVEQSAAPVVSGAHLDLTSGVGGATPYSAGTIALAGSVTAVNDAPQLTVATASLTTLKGNAVAVTGLSVSDIDAGSTPLLVTLTAGHGTLTLTNTASDAVITGNGTGSVTILATLATLNSLLAAANGLLYFSGPYAGPDTISILVNDQDGGGAGGALTASGTIGVTVVPPNASPVLKDTDLQLTVAAEALAQPAAGTAGFTVSKLVGLNGAGVANVTDDDKEAVTGIALIGANESYGRWWYSTDNGATWKLVGTVNDSDSALLLRSTDRLYFQPNAAVPGTVSGALTIRAWDQTSGTYGTKVAVDHSDGSAFSAATDSLTLHPGVLLPNGSFASGLTGWTATGGASVGATGDGHEGTITSAGGQTPTQLEDFLGLAHGSIAAATGTVPSYGHAMKLASTVTVTQDTVLTFSWSFTFSDPGYHDFSFVSVNGVVKLLAKEASASGTFTMVIPANTTLSLGFGTSDTSDNSVNPILRVDNIKLTTVASDPIVLDLAGGGLSLRPLSDGVHFDVTGDGVADQTGWIGTGNALLVRDENRNGRIDDARELVSEQFGKGFGSSLEALASLDDNHDGRIDAADLSFATLKVWQDANTDGVSQAGELRTLTEAGVRSIAATGTPSDATVAGNRILGTTSVTMADGSAHMAAGVAFDVKAAVSVPTISAQVQSQPAAGGTDFAAMLASGLGLPASGHASVAQSGVEFHGTAWDSTAHDPNLHHTQSAEPNGTHPSIHS